MKRLGSLFAFAFILILSLASPALAQTFTNPLCPNAGSGTKVCVGALDLTKGGFGINVSTGLTPNYVAQVDGTGKIVIAPLTASNIPNLLGDVTGPLSATVLSSIRGLPVSAVAALPGQVLTNVAGTATWATPSNTFYQLVSDVVATTCNVASNVVATDHVILPLGAASGFTDNVIGLYTAPVAVAGTASIAGNGSRITGCTISAAGPQFVSATGTLVPFSSLVSNNYSKQVAVCTTAGVCYIKLGEGFQVP